jgi:hypothetical protein
MLQAHRRRPWQHRSRLPPANAVGYDGRCMFLEIFGLSIYFSKMKEKIYKKKFFNGGYGYYPLVIFFARLLLAG